MFRCLECGKSFAAPIVSEENHGFTYGPFEKRYVCPSCKGSGYKPFILDEVSRREVLSKLIDIMISLNGFEGAICEVFSQTALDGTSLDSARSDMFDLIISVAGDSEFQLPKDIDAMLFDARSDSDAQELFGILTKNIEGE